MSEPGSQMEDGGSAANDSESVNENQCNILEWPEVAVAVAKASVNEFNKKLYCICQQEYKHGNLMFQCEGMIGLSFIIILSILILLTIFCDWSILFIIW